MNSLNLVLSVVVGPSLDMNEEEKELYYRHTLKPLLSSIYDYPDIPLTIFMSGTILEWLENRHNEYLNVLTEMIKRKQVEILGGGYYNPLLPLLPAADRLGQLEELTTTVRRLLGRRPRGAWLTHAIWDSCLSATLTGSGMEYTFLDEQDFLDVGIEERDLGFPFVTETQGRILTCLPVSLSIGSSLIKGNFTPLENAFQNRSGNDNLLVVLLSLESKDFNDFFIRKEFGFTSLLKLLRQNYPSLVCTTPTNYLKKNQKAKKKVYFSPTDYETFCRRLGLEIPKSNLKQNWKQFLTDYDSTARLYSKMIHVHLLANALRGDKYKKRSAMGELWKGQNLWGYVPDNVKTFPSKAKAYQSLLSAEILARDRVSFHSSLTAQDFDLDGVDEYLFQGTGYNFFIDPVGAVGIEWDYLDKPWNWANVYTTPGKVPPSFFVDRFFHLNAPDKDAAAFYKKEFHLEDLNREQKSVKLAATDDLYTPEGSAPIRLRKIYSFSDNQININIEIELLGGAMWEGWYTCESFFNFDGKEKGEFHCHGAIENSSGGVIKDLIRNAQFDLSWTPNAAWNSKVTFLLDDERLYHSHRFSPKWYLNLKPGEIWKVHIQLTLS